ncbi:MAG: L-ribulose-5-phosphate 4-epimerase AraD [Verrucomicrobia bacterium]|nr:L-ribulose-5-phosphate 4-epimerase AraD [Verrucomicrobiota bacterium]
MLDELRQEICLANQELETSGLVKLTFGNVSGIDRDKGIFGIKPSGVAYADLKPEQIVLIDLEGKIVEGDLRPSSDTKTHLKLYQSWQSIGGITHTHSIHATTFAQAECPLPCFGTTHADHFYGEVPLCRALDPEEVEIDYEGNTGVAIVQHFEQNGLDPITMPAVLQKHHAPFTWGKNAKDSVKNSIALEVCAKMAIGTLQLAPASSPIPAHILEKHHQRKHGANAYYGQ